MVGTRWKDWNTMPIRLPRKRASASSSSRDRSVPSTTTRPESGRSRPAMVISRVDLPEPDGPTRPTASPRPIDREIAFRMCTRAAPRPRLRSTSSSAMALSCILENPMLRRESCPAQPVSYGNPTHETTTRPRQGDHLCVFGPRHGGRGPGGCRGSEPAAPAGGARGQPHGRLQSAPDRRLSDRAREGAAGERSQCGDRQRRSLGRHRHRRPRPARLVGSGRHRRRNRGTRGQRHAPRPRPGDHAQRDPGHRLAPRGAQHPSHAGRHLRTAESRRRLRPTLRFAVPGHCGPARPRALPLLPRRGRRRPQPQPSGRPSPDRQGGRGHRRTHPAERRDLSRPRPAALSALGAPQSLPFERGGHAQMDYALDRGVNFFDTAELYSIPPKPETQGSTERIIGTWFRSRGTRDRVILASKVAGRSEMTWFRDDGSRAELSKVQIEEAVNKSLRRLKTDYIDLYQLHWPDRPMRWGANPVIYRHQDGPSHPIEEILSHLQDIVRTGKVRHVGLSNESAWGTMTFLKHAEARDLPRLQSVQNAYSLLNRTYETALAEISIREQVSLLAYSPLAQGYLTGKYLNGARPPGARTTLFERSQRYQTPGAEPAIERYVGLARDFGLDPAQMALAFVNARPFVTSTIIGATSMEQLRTDIGSIDMTITAELEDKINEIHLVHTNPCA